MGAVRLVRWQRGLLLLAVVLGVVSMHSTVVSHLGGGPHPALARMSSPAMSAEPMSVAPAEAPPSAATASPAHAGDGHPGSGLHDLLHLCLAVLTGLIVAVALTLFAIVAARAARSAPTEVGRSATGPRAPPPPTSVRLARLCVLRN